MKDEIGEVWPIDQYETDTMLGGEEGDNRTSRLGVSDGIEATTAGKVAVVMKLITDVSNGTVVFSLTVEVTKKTTT
jgi:hypothetical protein